MPLAATRMQLKSIILSKVRERQIPHDVTISQNMIQNELSVKQKQNYTYREEPSSCQEGRGRGRDGVGGWG